MGKFRLRPISKETDLSTLDVNQIEFMCNMAIVNKIIAKKKNIEWSDDTQSMFDQTVKVYFLVKKNLHYSVHFGIQIDQLIESGRITLQEVITDKGRICINHFIKSLI